jgi:hypothetical protein
VKASLFCIQKFEVCSHQGSVKRVQTGVGELLKPFDLFGDVAASSAHGAKLLGRKGYDDKQRPDDFVSKAPGLFWGALTLRFRQSGALTRLMVPLVSQRRNGSKTRQTPS